MENTMSETRIPKDALIQPYLDRANPGDVLVVEQRETQEALTIRRSGREGEPIHLRATGTILRGDRPVVGWRDAGPRKWTVPCAVRPDQVFLGGMRLMPSSSWDHWRFPTEAFGRDGFRDAGLKRTGGSLVGAVGHVRLNYYRMHHGEITTHTEDGHIVLSGTPLASYSTRFGYWVSGSPNDLRGNGEWAWQDGVLWVTSDEEPRDVTVSRIGVGVNVQAGVHDWRIEGLTVRRQLYYGVQAQSVRRVRLDRCCLEDQVRYGFVDWGSSQGLEIMDSTFSGQGWAGMRLHAQDVRVEGNRVHRIGVDFLFERLLHDRGLGIHLIGVTGLVAENRMETTGGNGITRTSHGSEPIRGLTISKNIVKDSCIGLTDGANIYWGGRAAREGVDIIRDNLCEHAYGDVSGTPKAQERRAYAYGVYVDDSPDPTNRVAVVKNAVIDAASAGVFVHDPVEGSNLSDNTITSCPQGILITGRTHPGHTVCRNVIRADAGSRSLVVRDDIDSIAASDHNRFRVPESHLQYRENVYTLAQWRKFGLDLNSLDEEPSPPEGDPCVRLMTDGFGRVTVAILGECYEAEAARAVKLPTPNNLRSQPVVGGRLQYTFDLPRDGTYYVWVCLRGTKASVLCRIDDFEMGAVDASPDWEWRRMATYQLLAGPHALFATGLGEYEIYRFFVTNAPGFDPGKSRQ
jgi:hypothetical protein